MSDQPLVSIVTPAYNQADYLVATIESVLAQVYPNIEYIVINDGSVDNTEDILRSYGSRLKWATQKNSGQAAALNNGWGMSSGKYVGYLSSDDILYPEAIDSLVAVLEGSPEIGVAYFDFDIINQRGIRVKTVRTEEYDKDRLVKDLVCQPGVGALFRKDLFCTVGGWSTALRQVPDFEFWLRMADYTSFKRVGEVLGAYRVHEGSASFGEMAIGRANEIVHVIDDYWYSKNKSNSRSKSKARVLAAKNHAQSMRISTAVVMFCKALALYPLFILDFSVWRVIFSGLFRSIYYKAFNVFVRTPRHFFKW